MPCHAELAMVLVLLQSFFIPFPSMKQMQIKPHSIMYSIDIHFLNLQILTYFILKKIKTTMNHLYLLYN